VAALVAKRLGDKQVFCPVLPFRQVLLKLTAADFRSIGTPGRSLYPDETTG